MTANCFVALLNRASLARSVMAVEDVAAAAVKLRKVRAKLLGDYKLSLRGLYASMEKPGAHPLKDAHRVLDDAVRKACRMAQKEDVLTFLLKLNPTVAVKETNSEAVQAPGIPECIKDPVRVLFDDRLRM